MRTKVAYYTRGGKTLASIALWCTCCTVATSAFNVDPIPPWAAPKEGAGDGASGG